ncbi:hypothetical protein [Subtercola lobariae]|uniref:Uncharacterized protein n=1 Tax=Subtercola lobariae TaxID=1588641 RepID=A0A917EX58_9MICO|nr:hypothetical protein [Subtercola lobariae]GGF27705.1 hypothetical protein GCM10011399_21250 [Subtercola lobariae]
MSDITHHLFDATITVVALWAIISVPVAIALGQVIRIRDQH